jgi:histidyl-tRNA synthetase
MIADAEVLAVFSEMLTEIGALAQFNYTIDISHRGLLALIVSLSGVPKEKFRSVCSSVDKLDKVAWEEVRSELINVRGLRVESVEKLRKFTELIGDPRPTLATLVERLQEEYQTQENGAARFEKEAAPLINEFNLLFDYLEALKVLPKIRFNLSLARGLDYYTGLIFEAAAEGKPGSDIRVGSIVGGGRYSDLVGMFSGKEVPAVGGSLGIERVFALLEDRLTDTITAVDTEVFVCSVGRNFTKERLAIASELWAAGIPAEFSYKEKPDPKSQFGQAAGCGAKLAITIAPDEVANGTVKVKILAENREITVPRVDLLTNVRSLLGK